MEDNIEYLNSKIAFLETHLDLLETEVSNLHDHLLLCGFTEGLTTLKQAVDDLIKNPDA